MTTFSAERPELRDINLYTGKRVLRPLWDSKLLIAIEWKNAKLFHPEVIFWQDKIEMIFAWDEKILITSTEIKVLKGQNSRLELVASSYPGSIR